MGDLFGAGPELDYEQRKATLNSQGVAVWDVLQSSVRPGSLDANIDPSTAVSNNFEKFFGEYCHIKFVFFNGQSADKLFRKFVPQPALSDFDDIQFETLPSTSPAHAAMSFADKLERWRIVRHATTVGVATGKTGSQYV